METWPGELNRVLAVLRRANGGIASERTKDVTKEAVRTFMHKLYEAKHPVQKLTNVGDRHIELVVRAWYFENKLQPKTIQNYVSRLRVVFSQLGKPNLVRPWQDYLPEVPAGALVIKTAAEKSKGFTANGVDLAGIFETADKVDSRFGLMLRLELAFGLRRKEVLHCRPWIADRGTDLRVYPGEGKTGRSRDIPIATEHQRQILKYVQTKIGKTKRLGWDYDGNGQPTTLEKNLKRYDNLASRIGCTKKDLGVTLHGLRAQFAENCALFQEFVPATLGGTTSDLPKEELELRRTVVSLSLGHGREKITAAYYGALIKRQCPDEQARFREVLAEGAAALQAKGLNQQPPDECMADVQTLTGLLATEDGVEISLAKVYQLWKIHSARFAMDWAPLESGMRQALEVAARQATIDCQRAA